MSTSNRQRRAAKARRRGPRPDNSRAQPVPQPGSAYGPRRTAPETPAADERLRQLLRVGVPGHADGLISSWRMLYPESEQQHAIDKILTDVVARLVQGGWTPRDLSEVGRRGLGAAELEILLRAVAAETARHPAARVHPQWRAQLQELLADEPLAGAPHSARGWAQQYQLSWPPAAARLVEVLIAISHLPKIETVLPPPGSPLSGLDASVAGVDEAVLRKVRALLAKAESTEFDGEADALTAKAQQLMTRYAIDRALAESDEPTAAAPVVRRVWLDSPYVTAKSLLIGAVARANHCRTVLTKRLDLVTVLGHPADLDVVELLSTSLLVQATRAMTLAGAHTTRSGASRTLSYRQAFLVAYAGRIGERLTETAAEAEAHADSEHRGALLPVLAGRDQAVEDAFTRAFPDLVRRDISVSNAAGYGAGRAAADLADLDVRAGLPAHERAG